MTTGGGDLLGLLRAAGVSRAGASGAAGAAKEAGPSTGEFAELLRKAASGELVSGVPVTVDPGAGVTLSEDQLARLSLAADRAEAEGIQSAAVMMDGMTLVMDVKTRTVMRRVDLSAGVLTGIDGIVTVGESGAGAPTGAVLLPPGQGLAENPSLLALLASRGGEGTERTAG